MIINEIWKNRSIAYRLSIIDLKSSFKASIFSYFWIFLNPLLMIGVYLFSFYASGDNIEIISLPTYNANESVLNITHFQNYSKIGWLIIGVITWSYFGSVIANGSVSIRNYNWLVTKIGSPISIPPTLVTLSKSYVGFIVIFVAWIIYMIIAASTGNQVIGVNILQLPLMLVFSFIFLLLWSLIFAPLTAISRDVFNLISIIPFFLQWITGVFLPLSASNANSAIGIIFRINPFNFLIDNIRGSIMGNSFFWNDWLSMVSFFGFVIIFLLIAMFLNKRSKKVIVDLL